MTPPREEAPYRLRLPPDARGRLDAALARLIPDLSRRRLKAAFRAGAVRVEGRQARGSERARPGAEVTIERWGPRGTTPEIEVVWEDETLLVVEKPPGLPSAPLVHQPAPSVAGAVAERFPELGGVGDLPGAPGLCHRLDTDTSGLLLFARTEDAFAAVRAAFVAGEVEKTYLAVVEGSPPETGASALPLGRRRGRGRRMVVVAEAGQARRLRRTWPARTTFRVLERHGGRALLEVRIATGVTHQIRAHLAHLGFPVAGDPLYGAGEGRLGLHAWRVRLPHPRTGTPIEVTSRRDGEVRALLHAPGPALTSP